MGFDIADWYASDSRIKVDGKKGRERTYFGKNKKENKKVVKRMNRVELDDFLNKVRMVFLEKADGNP